jgi:hypothetical protein
MASMRPAEKASFAPDTMSEINPKVGQDTNDDVEPKRQKNVNFKHAASGGSTKWILIMAGALVIVGAVVASIILSRDNQDVVGPPGATIYEFITGLPLYSLQQSNSSSPQAKALDNE